MTDVSKPGVRVKELVVHAKSRVLDVTYADGQKFSFSFEFLRVNSPSAEVLGHGPGQEVLQTNKRDIDILQLEPVGNYGVKPVFDDGHETGIFSWDYLLHLGQNQERLWGEYLAKLSAAGATRDALPQMRSIPIKRVP
jgi:DUF971 family protein